MLELQVRFDFRCACCGNPMGVTLKCAGRGLRDNPSTSIGVPCPTCRRNVRIRFRPDGTLLEVAAFVESALTEPSWN